MTQPQEAPKQTAQDPQQLITNLNVAIAACQEALNEARNEADLLRIRAVNAESQLASIKALAEEAQKQVSNGPQE